MTVRHERRRNSSLRTQTMMRLGAVVGVAMAAVGCGPSREMQCQQLGSANQEAQERIQSLYQETIGQPMDVPEFEEKLSQIRAESAQAIATVELSDQTLLQLRDRLAQAYQHGSDVSAKLATQLPDDGRLDPQMEEEVMQLRLNADHDIPPTIHEINLYCLGG